jgi:phosphoribosyl-dephospho-CoA transferase
MQIQTHLMQTHCLLRIIDPASAVSAAEGVPPWVAEQLTRTPWVVVRRAHWSHGLVPVGVRGYTRAQRFAGWLQPASVVSSVTPLQLAARRDWARAPRAAPAALAALPGVESLMARTALATRWGPAGSVAFELASGCATVTAASDLDLVLQLDAALAAAPAAALLGQLMQLPARADVLLETPAGAVALGEYARGRPPYLVRTTQGPRLLDDPWAGTVAAA